jgi:hypothetical protein
MIRKIATLETGHPAEVVTFRGKRSNKTEHKSKSRPIRYLSERVILLQITGGRVRLRRPPPRHCGRSAKNTTPAWNRDSLTLI